MDEEVCMRQFSLLLTTVLGFAFVLADLAMAQRSPVTVLETLGPSYTSELAINTAGQVTDYATSHTGSRGR